MLRHLELESLPVTSDRDLPVRRLPMVGILAIALRLLAPLTVRLYCDNA